MGQVNVRVNGYNHAIGCRDGEEQHVLALVGQIEEKVGLLRGLGGQLSESRMLLHVALLLADEANDLRTDLHRAQRALAEAEAAPPAPMAAGPDPALTDPALAERLTRIAERIEGMAQGLEGNAAG